MPLKDSTLENKIEGPKSANRLLVICIDRDDDIGKKAGIKSPAVGRNSCIEAAQKLALEDPEDADSNSIFAAIKTYEDLVSKGYQAEVVVVAGNENRGFQADEITDRDDSKTRFELPRPDVMWQGNRTFLRNFADFPKIFRRDSCKLLQYLSKELATPAEIAGDRAVFVGKRDPNDFLLLFERYVKDYLECPTCNSPDLPIRAPNLSLGIRIDFSKLILSPFLKHLMDFQQLSPF